jgi:hypothetical protein
MRALSVSEEYLVDVPACNSDYPAIAIHPLNPVLGVLSSLGGDNWCFGVLGREFGNLVSIEWEPDAIPFESEICGKEARTRT